MYIKIGKPAERHILCVFQANEGGVVWSAKRARRKRAPRRLTLALANHKTQLIQR